MRISIAQRLKPFSHAPGVCSVIPGTNACVQVFPALLRVAGQDIPLDVEGPVRKFTVQQDLEKGCIRVWGHTERGFMRYRLEADGWIAIRVEKGSPIQEQVIPWEGEVLPKPQERLSLGSHKAQDWDLVTRRHDLTEIFPFWLRLGAWTPCSKPAQGGTAALLEACRDTRDLAPFEHVLLAGFRGILCPQLEDSLHQGFDLPAAQEGDPATLLAEGARLIRGLFFRQETETLHILPYLPIAFHCGRFIDIDCGDLGTLDCEWSKKALRRMVFRADRSATVQFMFPKNCKRYRLRLNPRDRGEIVSCDTTVPMEAGQYYFFDNFQK